MFDSKKTLTFYLFARPSFIEGAARIFAFGSNLQVYNYSKSTEEADAKAIHNDWSMIGKDIKSSIEQYGKEQKEALSRASNK